jgi:hypothetical protein
VYEEEPSGNFWKRFLWMAPLLYLLSAPPIVYGAMKCVPIRWNILGQEIVIEQRHADTYAAPYKWLAKNTPLEKPMMAYAIWWRDTVGAQPAPAPAYPPQ